MPTTLDQRIAFLQRSYVASDREIRLGMADRISALAVALEAYRLSETAWLQDPTNPNLKDVADAARQELGNKRGGLTRALAAARQSADEKLDAGWEAVKAPEWEPPAEPEP